MTDTSLIHNEKRTLRARMKAWRATLPPKAAAAAGEALAKHGLGFLPALPPGSIAGLISVSTAD